MTIQNRPDEGFMQINDNGRIVISATKEELIQLIGTAAFDVKCNAYLALEILMLRQAVHGEQDGVFGQRMLSADHLATYIWEDDLEHENYADWVHENGMDPTDHVLFHAGRYLGHDTVEFNEDLANFQLREAMSKACDSNTNQTTNTTPNEN